MQGGETVLNYVPGSWERSWFERPEGMSKLLHTLLIQRGVASEREAEEFLHPDETWLHDPLLLPGMAETAALLRDAMAAAERICIYGDYDVDGVCACAILSDYLTRQGAQVEVYIPSRHDEGYGLNEAAVRKIAQRADVLLTVDCGIASAELIELAESLGLRCAVTDHHRPGERIPACPVVNPLIGDYPCSWLCGAGVAFKLVDALGGRGAALAYIDLAAVATVADVVTLAGENRAIVKLGLDRINLRPRPGIAALMERARLAPGKLTSQGIAFRLAPRLNAGGRLGSAMRSFALLTQTDEFMAVALADELEGENARRQLLERQICAEADAQLSQLDFSAHRILLARGEGWNPGVIGLAAARLCQKYYFPVIVFSQQGDMLTGSCRSTEGVDIYQTLCAVSELIDHFGGHAQAAGLTLRADYFGEFWARLDEYLTEHVRPEAYVPLKHYDMEVRLNDLTEEAVRELQGLEPTGHGNPEPMFRARAQVCGAQAIGSQGNHLRLRCMGDGVQFTGIFFGEGARAQQLNDWQDLLDKRSVAQGGYAGERSPAMELLFTPALHCWNGATDVQLKLSAMRDADVREHLEAQRQREGRLAQQCLTELLWNRRADCTPPSDELSLKALRERLADEPRGVFIYCAGFELAEALLEALDPCPLDVYFGEAPEDVRGFNSLVIWPGQLERLPRAVHTLVLAGLCVPEELGARVRQYSLELPVPGGLQGGLPDVDQLRGVYRAALELSRRPIQLGDMEMLNLRLSEETGFTPTCCHVSLLALMDLRLVKLNDRPFKLIVPHAARTDPQSSSLWRAVQRLRESFG